MGVDGPFLSSFVHGWWARVVQPRQVSQQCLDGGHSRGRVFEMIVCCGRHRKPIAPVVLLVGRQVSQKQFHPLILSFRDSVRLGMKGRGYVLLYAEALAQHFGEM